MGQVLYSSLVSGNLRRGGFAAVIKPAIDCPRNEQPRDGNSPSLTKKFRVPGCGNSASCNSVMKYPSGISSTMRI